MPPLPPVEQVFAFPQLLQHASPELGPVLILELLEAQGQMELGRVAAQKGIVLLLLTDSGGTLKTEKTEDSHPLEMNTRRLSSVHDNLYAGRSFTSQNYG